MNLQKLFIAQAELDAYIEQQHPTTEGENRSEKKVLALLVELGECANEWRGFKFWSNNQEPKMTEEVSCDDCKGLGYIANYDKLGDCVKCNNTGQITRNLLLEEYVDCLHFILSIGNDLGVNNFYVPSYSYPSPEFTTEKITTQFALIYNVTTELMFCQDDFSKLNYRVLLKHFELLGRMLGFTIDQIESAYWKKYKINKQRQVEGY